MKNNQYNSLYAPVTIPVPETVEEFDALAKRNGAALDAAVKFVVFHKALGDARDLISDAVVKDLSFPRQQVDTGRTRKDGSKILVDEDPKDHIDRLFAEREWDKDAPPQVYLDLVAAVQVPFDPSATERKGTSRVLPKSYLEAGKRILANGNGAKWAAEFGITLLGDAEADATLLGWQIKQREDAKRRAEEERTRALYS